jgi:hypothetical protein
MRRFDSDPRLQCLAKLHVNRVNKSVPFLTNENYHFRCRQNQSCSPKTSSCSGDTTNNAAFTTQWKCSRTETTSSPVFRNSFPHRLWRFSTSKCPASGGLQVLKYLKTLPRQPFPKIILTGNQDLNLMNTAYQLGAQSFLMKPLEKRQFCGLMAKVDGIVMDGCAEEADL